MYEPTIQFTGRLTADPRLTYTKTGKAVCSFTVANNPRKQNQDGTWEDGEPLFLNCSIFTKQAEPVADTLHKGDSVVISGTVTANNWTSQDGARNSSFKVFVITIGKAISRKATTTQDYNTQDYNTQDYNTPF